MTLPAIANALQMTWPAAQIQDIGPWRIRDGAGAGRRASAASPIAEVTDNDIGIAEEAMRALPMAPLFAVRSDQPELNAMLLARGYRAHDHSVYYAGPVDSVAQHVPGPVRAFEVWEPLSIMEDIWRANDIAQPRIDLMHRATCDKMGIIGRTSGRAAGAAFVGAHDGYALIHALVVDPRFHRQGMGRDLTAQAAIWAKRQGCHTFALAVGRENQAARALYASLGMTPVGEYHYCSLSE